MKYVSTRDPRQEEKGFNEVLTQGLAPDGGLYVPVYDEESLQRSTLTQLRLSRLGYEGMFAALNGVFIGGEIPYFTQLAIAEDAYSKGNFPSRSYNTIAPITEISEGIYVQDLSDGPTYAFKDHALQIVCRQMNHVLGLTSSYLDILGGTSGDTGSAAGEGVLPNNNMAIFMLSSEDGPTRFQKGQMKIQCHDGSNVHHIQMPFNFDTLQDMVKQLKRRPGLEDLGALNSINWARVAAQIAYYFSGYMQAIADGGNFGDPVDFVIPTGNYGNVLAGYYARKMGLPIRNLVIATNENDVLVDLVARGVYNIPESTQKTTSPSMDINVSSNFERLLYDLFDKDPERTAEYMSQVKPGQTVKFADHSLSPSSLLNIGFQAFRSDATSRIETIREVHATTGGFLIDPHTADAVSVARRLRATDPDVKIVCLATADPVKFEATMEEALGFVPERKDPRTIGLEERADKVGRFVLLDSIDQVEAYIRKNRINR